MIYVPILKNREAELRAIKKCDGCLSTDIIPFFEIINDHYISKYKMDADGNRVMELKPGNKKKTPVKVERTDEDICTLERLHEIMGDNKCFVEYYRYSENEYSGNSIDLNRVELARTLSFDYKKYVDRTIQATKYKNFIPIISIKKGFKISHSDLEDFIKRIRDKSHILGVRIQIEMFDDYQSVLEEALNDKDYLLVDIGEKPYKSQRYLLEDVAVSEMKSKCILLNSPRHKDVIKRDYQLDGWEPLIDNIVAERYDECGFSGFGDYAGLKDTLPESIPVRSYILALLYDKNRNEFWSIRSHDKGDSAEVKRIAIGHATYFDSDDSCRGYKEIRRIEKGSQMSWNEITIIRYIDQMSKKLREHSK